MAGSSPDNLELGAGRDVLRQPPQNRDPNSLQQMPGSYMYKVRGTYAGGPALPQMCLGEAELLPT